MSNPSSPHPVSASRRFACPFFKHDPEAHARNHICRGDGKGQGGFPTTARVKEHLYRTHLVHRCFRCQSTFSSGGDLLDHSKQRRACVARDRTVADTEVGIDQAQKEALRCRKVKTWSAIYQIVFPNTKEGDVPYQYYEDQTELRRSFEVVMRSHHLELYLTEQLLNDLVNCCRNSRYPSTACSPALASDADELAMVLSQDSASGENASDHCFTRGGGLSEPNAEAPRSVPQIDVEMWPYDDCIYDPEYVWN